MVSASWLYPDYIIIPTVLPVDRPTKIEFGNWFDLAIGFEHSAELLGNGNWDVSNPWRAMALRLSSLSPVAYFDEVPTETHALGTQVVAAFFCYVSNDDYKDFGVG